MGNIWKHLKFSSPLPTKYDTMVAQRATPVLVNVWFPGVVMVSILVSEKVSLQRLEHVEARHFHSLSGCLPFPSLEDTVEEVTPWSQAHTGC